MLESKREKRMINSKSLPDLDVIDVARLKPQVCQGLRMPVLVR
jgi:hypothetical protein